MSPFVSRMRPRGVGLFCQASTGADGLHGTDMGTKNQREKMQKAFLESARRLGSERWSFAPFLMKINCPYLWGKKKRLKSRPLSSPPVW